MNLQNGYKVIYEKTADGKRTFYATKNVVCDPNVDDKIIEATIGEYKLIYEKNGQFYGSTTGIPTSSDYCFKEFDKVFIASNEETTIIEEPEKAAADDGAEPKTEPVTEPETDDPETEPDSTIVE